jgi:hypothetical protein
MRRTPVRVVLSLCLCAALVGCNRTTTTLAPAATQSPGYGEDVSDRLGPATIKDDDSGKTFIYPIGGEFSFDLHPSNFPPASLDRSECPNVQALKRLAPNGPSRYPLGFIVNRQAACTIRNGEFHVSIVVCVDATSESRNVCRVTGQEDPP